MPFLGSPKQNARRAARPGDRENEFEKVDFDERNPTVEGLVEIDVDACDRRRRQPSNVIRVCISATMAWGRGKKGQATRWEQYHLTPWNPWSNENPPPKYRLGKNCA